MINVEENKLSMFCTHHEIAHVHMCTSLHAYACLHARTHLQKHTVNSIPNKLNMHTSMHNRMECVRQHFQLVLLDSLYLASRKATDGSSQNNRRYLNGTVRFSESWVGRQERRPVDTSLSSPAAARRGALQHLRRF